MPVRKLPKKEAGSEKKIVPSLFMISTFKVLIRYIAGYAGRLKKSDKLVISFHWRRVAAARLGERIGEWTGRLHDADI